jgi:phage shock protein PspC (stress-responsive transcriptional regulator)
MKEINRIHLAKVPYEIEIDAKKELTKYFNDLQKYANDESIFDDVEIRVTEILSDLGVNKNDIISLEDVSKIKKQLGDPEVFADPDIVTETDEYEVKDANIKETVAKKKIYRDKSTAMIAGIASGLSVYLNIDVVLVRIIFLILVPVTFCWIIPIYIILWILIPSAKTASDILRLRGEKISAQSIKQVNEEYNFSLQEKRNDSVKTFFGILLGLGSVFAALIGLTLLVFVNIAVINDSTDSAVLNSYQGVPMALFSLAGILFVAFSITMAYIGFSRKITQSQIIALPVVIFIGITSFIAGFYVININESNHQSKIKLYIKHHNHVIVLYLELL